MRLPKIGIAAVFLVGLVAAIALVALGIGEPEDPEEGAYTTRPYRPADHLPKPIREQPKYPLPEVIDGYPCVDIYGEDKLLLRISPDALSAAKWQKPPEGPDLMGQRVPYRAPIDFETLPDLREFLRRAGIQSCSSVKVLSLGKGVVIERKMLESPDYRFYFLYNRRMLLKFMVRENLHDGPGGTDRWMMGACLAEPSWVVVESLPETGGSTGGATGS